MGAMAGRRDEYIQCQLQPVLRTLGMKDSVSAASLLAALRSAGLDVVYADLPTLSQPYASCTGCSGLLRPDHSKQVIAAVLETAGWTQVTHVPLRCQKSGCALSRKKVWYNFISINEQTHAWCWNPQHEMKYFFTHNTWGVSTQWLRQQTQRMAFQFTSFDAEADVHYRAAVRDGKTQVLPNRADLKLKEAWFTWRVAAALAHHAASRRCLACSQQRNTHGRMPCFGHERLGSVLCSTLSHKDRGENLIFVVASMQ